MKLRTDSLIKLSKFSVDELKELQSFVGEFHELGERLDLNIYNEWDKFLMSILVELGINEAVGICKLYYKPEYKDIIIKYRRVIKKLLDNDLLYLAYSTSFKVRYIREFVELINNFINNKKLVSKNLLKINELDIEAFEYDLDSSLDGTYEFKTIKKKDCDEIYKVIGIASDGKREWNYRDGDTLNFELRDAKYLIKYTKENNNSNVRMIIRDLMFSPESLPSKKELYDVRVLPYIDDMSAIINSTEKKHDELVEDIIRKSYELQQTLNKYLNTGRKLSLEEEIDVICFRRDLEKFRLQIESLEGKNSAKHKTLGRIKNNGSRKNKW